MLHTYSSLVDSQNRKVIRSLTKEACLLCWPFHIIAINILWISLLWDTSSEVWSRGIWGLVMGMDCEVWAWGWNTVSLLQYNSTLERCLVLVRPSCLTICNPMDNRPPGSPCPWNSPDKNVFTSFSKKDALIFISSSSQVRNKNSCWSTCVRIKWQILRFISSYF